uniref:transposase n=1 Tax=Streptomyces chartreusis TaxID=1969 RepID=UPI003F499BD8
MTPGRRHDSICARPLLERIRVPHTGLGRPRCRPDHVIADKAYSTRGFRAYLRRHRADHPREDRPAATQAQPRSPRLTITRPTTSDTTKQHGT